MRAARLGCLLFLAAFPAAGAAEPEEGDETLLLQRLYFGGDEGGPLIAAVDTAAASRALKLHFPDLGNIADRIVGGLDHATEAIDHATQTLSRSEERVRDGIISQIVSGLEVACDEVDTIFTRIKRRQDDFVARMQPRGDRLRSSLVGLPLYTQLPVIRAWTTLFLNDTIDSIRGTSLLLSSTADVTVQGLTVVNHQMAERLNASFFVALGEMENLTNRLNSGIQHLDVVSLERMKNASGALQNVEEMMESGVRRAHGFKRRLAASFADFVNVSVETIASFVRTPEQLQATKRAQTALNEVAANASAIGDGVVASAELVRDAVRDATRPFIDAIENPTPPTSSTTATTAAPTAAPTTAAPTTAAPTTAATTDAEGYQLLGQGACLDAAGLHGPYHYGNAPSNSVQDCKIMCDSLPNCTAFDDRSPKCLWYAGSGYVSANGWKGAKCYSKIVEIAAQVAQLTVSAATGRSCTPLGTVPSIGDQVFADRDFTFTSLGDFSGMSANFIKTHNDDKTSPSSSVLYTIAAHASITTVYLDFWGGDEHLAKTGASDWLSTWELTTMAGVQFLDGSSRYGPGRVYKKSFPSGEIEIMGQYNGQGYGIFLVFVEEAPWYPDDVEWVFAAYPESCEDRCVANGKQCDADVLNTFMQYGEEGPWNSDKRDLWRAYQDELMAISEKAGHKCTTIASPHYRNENGIGINENGQCRTAKGNDAALGCNTKAVEGNWQYSRFCPCRPQR